uniref:Uncharacterized protein n=1 Tax=Meloidogyne enterolobii TaxID=390850 RepID=A0A6V7W018_MELEN|nr:unnamed protein product [Meloidogyne enterolobii]
MNKVSMRTYLEAYDLFEVLALNLMIEMKNASVKFSSEFEISKILWNNIFPNWLKGIENDHSNIYPSIITVLDNRDPDNQTMINFIYQYEAVNEELNRQDCQELYSESMDEYHTIKFTPFYLYFYKLDKNFK